MARWLRRDERGFTLIEMMVVLAIIALIAVFAVPNVAQALQNARLKTVLAQARQIQAAFEEYFIDNAAYPDKPASNVYDDLFGSNGSLKKYIGLPPNESKALFNVVYYDINGNKDSYCLIIKAKNVSSSEGTIEIRNDRVDTAQGSTCIP